MKSCLIIVVVGISLISIHTVYGNSEPHTAIDGGSGGDSGGRRGGRNFLNRTLDLDRKSFNWTTSLSDKTVVERAFLSNTNKELRLISRDRTLKDMGYNKATTLMDFSAGKMAIYVQLPKLEDDTDENTVSTSSGEKQNVGGWWNNFANTQSTGSTTTSGTDILLERLRQWFASLQMNAGGRSKRAANQGGAWGRLRKRRSAKSACFITDTIIQIETASNILSQRTDVPLAIGSLQSFTAEAANIYTEETLSALSPRLANFCRRATSKGNTFRLVQSSGSSVVTGDEVFKVLGLIDVNESNMSIPIEIKIESSINLRD